jgi:hypothetical protein
LIFLDEFSNGAVIGSLRLGREKTGRQLIESFMIGNTFATDALAGTGFIGTVAMRQIGFFFTFHTTSDFSYPYI